MSFEPPRDIDRAGPLRLSREIKRLRKWARERGLLRGDELVLDPQIEAHTAALLDRLRRGQPIGTAGIRRLGQAVVWLHHEERAGEVQELRDAVVQGRLGPLGRDWFTLACLFYRDGDFAGQLVKVRAEMSKQSRARLDERLRGVNPAYLQSLPDVLATRAVTEGVRLDELTETLRIPAGSPVESAVWARLLSPAAAPWMAAQPRQALDKLLGVHEGHWTVGAIGRQILGTAMLRGATPADVAPGEELATLVAMVARRLPRNRETSPWRHLGTPERSLIQWWETHRDLEEFFARWNADPDRELFWRHYVRNIQGIEALPSASALAMRIGDYWFVEFGKVGNASRAYREQDWVRAAHVRRQRPSEKSIRDIAVDKVRRRTHREDWQPRFRQWIFELTEVRPSGGGG